MLETITFTGADESVEPRGLAEISDRHPFVEWGILVSEAKSGKTPRYPGEKWIAELEGLARNHPTMKLSVHVCGRWGRDLLVQAGLDGERPTRYFPPIFRRLQINCSNPKYDAEAMALSQWLRPIIIPIGGHKNQALLKVAKRAFSHVVPLLDESGGAGLLARQWPSPKRMAPDEYGMYGYAGGLGPENLREELGKIGSAVNSENYYIPFWVDMETRVRSSDNRMFDLDKVKECIEIAKSFQIDDSQYAGRV